MFTLRNILPAHVCKTAIQSLYVSCRSLFGRQGNLLPSDRYSYGQRFLMKSAYKYWSHISSKI